jgi:acetoin utilization deacetylase AcuC-like enzyme
MAVIYADDVFKAHDTGQHPECAQRLEAVYKRLADNKVLDRFEKGHVQAADVREVLRVHGAAYVKSLERFAVGGGGRIESDTVVSRLSYDVALKAVGAAIDAVDQVLSGKHQQAICLARPPGHHAVANSAMGFCLFNNVAIAAKHAIAQHQLERVLIVDWDVHHGNGTQDVFYEDPGVYFFSSHRYPFYPGSGAKTETGQGPGLGTTCNLPLAFGISRGEFRRRFTLELEKFAERCKPELVLVSAGFDAHRLDPIGSLGLESQDYADLTRAVADVAKQHCNGRIVSLLEGGYNVDALAESVQIHLETILDNQPQ